MKNTHFLKTTAAWLAALWLLVFTPAVSAAREGILAVSTANGAPGSRVEVTVDLKNNPGLASALFTVTFPEDLTLIAVTDGKKLGAAMHKPELTAPYTLSWVNDTATTNFTVNGTVVTLTFAIPENAKDGTVYPINVSYDYDNYEIMDVNGHPIRFTVEQGAVCVVENSVTTEATEFTTYPATEATTTATEPVISVTTAVAVDETAPPADNTLWWIVLGAVLLLLAAAVGGLFIKRKK